MNLSAICTFFIRSSLKKANDAGRNGLLAMDASPRLHFAAPRHVSECNGLALGEVGEAHVVEKDGGVHFLVEIFDKVLAALGLAQWAAREHGLHLSIMQLDTDKAGVVGADDVPGRPGGFAPPGIYPQQSVRNRFPRILSLGRCACSWLGAPSCYTICTTSSNKNVRSSDFYYARFCRLITPV